MRSNGCSGRGWWWRHTAGAALSVCTTCLSGYYPGRVDLKTDRKAGTLIVQRAHFEPGAPRCTAEGLIEELRLMASWLGLPDLAIAPAAAIDRLPPTLRVETQPTSVELAPSQSEIAFYE